MDFLVISSSISTLKESKYKSSSEKYEFALVNELQKFGHVNIYSISKKANNDFLEEIQLFSLNKGFLKRLCDLVRANKFLNSPICLFWGYDLKKVILMLLFRLITKTPVVPFIYDSHHESIKMNRKSKKALQNIYFNLGHSLIKLFDGAILFQENASKKMKLIKPFLVTKPGVSLKKTFSPKYTLNNFTVTYAGSFTKLNCIDILLKTFSQKDNSNIQLMMYGDGVLLNDVINYADKFENIHYCGVVDEEGLNKAYEKSNVLICLRDKSDVSNNYAFPSKLIEIMSTKIPVLASKINDDEEFNNKIFIVNDNFDYEITKQIHYIYNNYDLALEKAKESREYVVKKFNFVETGENIYNYLREIRELKNGSSRY